MRLNQRHKSVLLSSAALFAMGLSPSIATAQETTEDQTEADRRRLSTVTVTATRREASIQDVPIAVSAYNPEILERQGIQDLRSLDQVSASFNLNSSQTESQGTTIRIRGVGTTGNNIGLESSVGVFIDGVFQSRPGIALGDLVDLEQLEVLRGPQGTLFGRNTSAGALNITTKKPNLKEVEGFGNFTYGNFNAVNLQAGISFPLIKDELGIRVSGAYRERDGFLESTAGPGIESNNRDRYLIRGQLFWEPSDTFSFRLIGDYQEADEQCCDAIIVNDSPAFLAAAEAVAAAGGFAQFTPPAGAPAVGGPGTEAFEELISNGEQFDNPFEQWGISGQIDWDLGWGKVTYVGAYRDFFASSVQETDFVGLDVFSVAGETAVPGQSSMATFDDIKTQTHEIRVQGSAFNDRVDWLFGGFYVDEDILEDATLTIGPDFILNTSINLLAFGESVGIPTAAIINGPLGPNPSLSIVGGADPAGGFANNILQQDTNSWSIFTHNTIGITDNLDFTFGLRYVNESKDGSFTQGEVDFATTNTCLASLGAIGDPTLGGTFAPDSLETTFIGATSGVQAAFNCFPFAVAGGLPTPLTPQFFDEEFDDDELVYTVKLGYQVFDNINTYLSFTHGFKAGGFNLDSSAALGGSSPQFASETADVIEGGIKADLFGGRVRANFAAFHQILDDFQVLEFTGVQFTTFNVARAFSTGAELELQAQLTDQLSITSGLTYTDARYPDDCAGDSTDASVLNLCGADLTNAPEFVGIWGATWEDDFQLGGVDMTYFGNVNVRFETDRRTSTQPTNILGAGATAVPTPLPLPFDIQEANTKINLRFGIGRADGLWQIEGWAVNLTDEQTRNVTFNIPLRGFQSLAVVSGNPLNQARGAFTQAPRTYGVTIRTRF